MSPSSFSRAFALLAELRLRRKREVAWRVAYALRRRLGLARLLFPARPARSEDLRAVVLPQWRPLADEVLLARLGAAIAERVPDLLLPSPDAALMRVADDAVADRFRIFGQEMAFDGGAIDWHALHGGVAGQWPLVHWADVRYKGRPGVDVKDCWELARHQHLPALGLAWRATRDARYPAAFVRQLDSWCAQNPPEIGVHYASNMEIGLRCLSWIWADHLLRDAPAYTAAARWQTHQHLYYMARHLARNFSFTERTGRNNHLIGDAACLVAAGAIYANVFPDAQEWQKRGARALERALVKQVGEDGLHFECSPSYHLFVLQLSLVALATLRHNGASFAYEALDAVRRMAHSLRIMALPNGRLPPINDGDDGVALGIAASQHSHVAWTLDLAACLLQDQSPSLQSSERVHLFPKTGFVYAKAGDAARFTAWVLDNHRDPFPDSGHNHAALLQFICWVDGEPILVDSGTYRYNGHARLRDLLRSTHAHNCVTVEGRSLAEPSREFGWLHSLHPGETVLDQFGKALVASGWHDKLPGGIRHSRAVLWLPLEQMFVIADAVEVKSPVKLCQYWHLAPDIGSAVTRPGAMELKSKARAYLLEFPGNDFVEVLDSKYETIAAPCSPSYGILVHKKVIVRQWIAEGYSLRWTVMRPATTANPSDDGVPVLSEPLGLTLGSTILRAVPAWPLRLSLV